MNKPPSRDEIWSSPEPGIIFDPDEHDVIRFAYERQDRKDRPGAFIDLIVRHKRTKSVVHFHFKDVELKWLAPICGSAPIGIANYALRGWESPRGLSIIERGHDGDTGTLFWAADVEVCSTR